VESTLIGSLLRRFRRVPIWATCVIALAVFLAFVAFMISLAANWPYRPERYAGGIDPIRVGLVVGMSAGALVFALLALSALAAWRAGAGIQSLGTALSAIGMLIASGSIIVLVASMPPVAKTAVPLPLRIPLFLGVGLMFAGQLPSVVSGTIAAAKRGERGVFVAILVLAAVILVSILGRS
jgi:hypothetical protein